MNAGDRRMVNAYDGRGGDWWCAATLVEFVDMGRCAGVYAVFALDRPCPPHGELTVAVPLPAPHRIRSL